MDHYPYTHGEVAEPVMG